MLKILNNIEKLEYVIFSEVAVPFQNIQHLVILNLIEKRRRRRNRETLGIESIKKL